MRNDLISVKNFTDIALAKLDSDKKLSYINAWEENEKSKVENK